MYLISDYVVRIFLSLHSEITQLHRGINENQYQNKIIAVDMIFNELLYWVEQHINVFLHEGSDYTLKK